MRKIFLFFFILSYTPLLFAQYKNDGKLYQTVYLQDLCNSLQQHPSYLLLDVRSKGEFEDTSQYNSLNIGHLQHAINIDINQMPGRIPELQEYKDKPVYVYCSHSQRSRRVSKMLADSGYTRVYNINGGLSSLHAYDNEITMCDNLVLQKKTAYDIVSPATLLSGTKDFYIIDLRSDSVFNGTTTDEKRKAMGRFNHVTHVPFDQFSRIIMNASDGKNILLVDDYGNESPKAAQILVNRGYHNVSVLFNGMDGFIQFRPEKNKSNLSWKTPVPYEMLTAEAFDKAMSKKAIVIDVRKKEEFTNQSEYSFRNIGHVINAINIPVADLQASSAGLPSNKKTPILVYTFSSNEEVYQAARKLSHMGYSNVKVLASGLFNLRWKAANIKGLDYLGKWVVDVPEENL